MQKSKNRIYRLFAIIFAVALCISQISAVAEARASDYISSYEAYMSADGSGKVSVWFWVNGTGKMDELGATKIIIYDKSTGSVVNSYLYTQNSGMLGSGKNYHSGSVTYTGSAGKSYYAVAYLWAGKGGLGDSRAVTTSAVTAK